MTWAEVKVKDEVLKGIATEAMPNPLSGAFDERRIIPETEAAAKRSFRLYMQSNMTSWANTVTIDVLLDLIAGYAPVTESVDECMGWAYLEHHYRIFRITNDDTRNDNWQHAMERFRHSMSSMVRYLSGDQAFLDLIADSAVQAGTAQVLWRI